MTTAEQIANQVNEWIDHEQHQTEQSISALIWAMAMDRDLTWKVFDAVETRRAEEYLRRHGV